MEKLKQTGKVIKLHKDNEKKSDVVEEIMSQMTELPDSTEVIDEETGLTMQEIWDFYEKGDFSLGDFIRRRIAGSYCYNRNNERWFILDKETGIWAFDEQDLHQQKVHVESWQALQAALKAGQSFHKDFQKQFMSVIKTSLRKINKSQGPKDIAKIATQFTDQGYGWQSKVYG
ncbi:hypothetical protein [Desulfonatronovibrio magnus]|uniref:hypothetical protein n=1 Tax=Desulfonatronovibrio magnus TaxID=698827 RepID=UPI0005EBAD97|nr:hypothetical protein [Desulfonatronovibrio magnus]